MANRVIQAKIYKMKRKGRRKVWSGRPINTGLGPNKDVLAEYRGRTHGLKVTEEELREINKKFPRQDISQERMAAMLREKQVANKAPDLLYFGVPCSIRHCTVRLYFTTTRDCFFFVKRHKSGKSWRTTTYSRQERALDCYQRQKVTWVESKDSPWIERSGSSPP